MTRETRLPLLPTLHCFVLIAVLLSLAGTRASVAQQFSSSVVGTEFDFITADDPSAYESLTNEGQQLAEMPDKRDDEAELRKPAWVFLARFTDATSVHLYIDTALGDEATAKAEAMRFVHPLGKLPTALRAGVERVVVHAGGPDTTAFSDRGLIVLYSENATRRIETHDLEETTFHESVHAAWDATHAGSDAWRRAQQADPGFATSYGMKNPDREDLAESALFAFALLHHPDRLPAAVGEQIRDQIPNRILYIAELIPPGKPLHYSVAGGNGDSGEDKTLPSKSEMHYSGAGDSAAMENDAPSRDPADQLRDVCSVDITLPGSLADILSNCLMLEFDIEEGAVTRFLTDATIQAADSRELFRLTAVEFELPLERLAEATLRCLHVNCEHDDVAGDEQAALLLKSWSR